MPTKKNFKKIALVLSLSLTMLNTVANADTLSVVGGVIAAPVLIPFSVVEMIQQKKADKELKKMESEELRRQEAKQIAELQEMTSFLAKGCQFSDFISPKHSHLMVSVKVDMLAFPDSQQALLEDLSADEGKKTFTIGEKEISEKFGDVDHIPAQDARKHAVKKLKEMIVKYTNSNKRLNGFYSQTDLNKLSKDDQKLAVNFACDAAQVRISNWYFKEVMQTRALAKVKMEKNKFLHRLAS